MSRDGPIRTCIGCGERDERDRLLRLLPGADRRLTLDLGKGAHGRGAWVHPRRGCLERAEGHRAVGRAFRGKAKPPRAGALQEAARDAQVLREEE